MAFMFTVSLPSNTMAKRFVSLAEETIDGGTPVDSGKLLAANRYSRNDKVVTIQNNKDYAAPVHEGSRPHKIVAKNAKALKFTVGGKTVFARSVWHPGTKANPFIEAGIFAVLEYLNVKGAFISKEIQI